MKSLSRHKVRPFLTRSPSSTVNSVTSPETSDATMVLSLGWTVPTSWMVGATVRTSTGATSTERGPGPWANALAGAIQSADRARMTTKGMRPIDCERREIINIC